MTELNLHKRGSRPPVYRLQFHSRPAREADKVPSEVRVEKVEGYLGLEQTEYRCGEVRDGDRSVPEEEKRYRRENRGYFY